MPRRWRPPIWLHLPLTIVVAFLSFFGGALGGAALLRGLWFFANRAGIGSVAPAAATAAVLSLLAVVCFFGGAIGALCGSFTLLRRFLPAACPKCRGRAYLLYGRYTSYYCRDCGYVLMVSVPRGERWLWQRPKAGPASANVRKPKKRRAR